MKVELHWRCGACPEHGDGPTSDLDARKHGDATKHPTVVWGVPRAD